MSDKMQGDVKAGSTDVTIPVLLRSTTDNTEVTGKAYGDVTASYQRQGAIRTAISAVTQTVTGAHTNGGFKEIDATNMPGNYRFDIPDAAFATGVDFVIVSIKVAGCYVFYQKYFLTTNVIQTGDPYARLGAPAGASMAADLVVIDNFVDEIETRLSVARAGYLDNLNNLPDSGSLNDLATLVSRLTAPRAGYLDKLNITGNVASSAEVTAIQNNTNVRLMVPKIMERPDAGSSAYVLHLYLYDDTGNMEAPDSTPTIAAENHLGTDRSANLGTVTLVATGHYKVTYTLDSGDAIEQLLFEWSVIEGAVTTLHGDVTQVVDTTAVDFTAADRTKLEEIQSKLPANYIMGSSDTTDKDDEIDAIVTAIAALPADVWDRIISKANHNVPGSSGKLIRELGVLISVEGAVTGTPTATVFTTNITGYDDDFFKDQVVSAYNGADQAGQGKVISAYNGTTGEFTVDEGFTTPLNAGDDVVVFTPHVHPVSQIAAAVGARVVEGSLTADGILKIGLAALVGKSSGGGSETIIFKANDGTTTRITATVDGNGNRTLVILNAA